MKNGARSFTNRLEKRKRALESPVRRYQVPKKDPTRTTTTLAILRDATLKFHIADDLEFDLEFDTVWNLMCVMASRLFVKVINSIAPFGRVPLNPPIHSASKPPPCERK